MSSEKRREAQARVCARFWQWVFVLCAIAFALLPLLLTSCSAQMEREPDGSLTANFNFLSKGSLKKKDGTVMRGDSNVAARELGKYGGALLKAGLIRQGVDAVTDLGGEALEELAD